MRTPAQRSLASLVIAGALSLMFPSGARADTALDAASERGRALAERFECNRCHDGAGLTPAPRRKHCVHCHQAIEDGRYPGASARVLSRWQENVTHLVDVPSLDVRGRLRASWIERFLKEPRDLRPSLGETMPRLPIADDEARDLARWLAGPDDDAAVAFGDAARGRVLLEEKGCGSCHRMSGVMPLPMTPPAGLTPGEIVRGMKLAPDLALTRDRFVRARLVEWIVDPRSVSRGARMPALGLSVEEARDIAAYLVSAPLDPALDLSRRVVGERLPLLERPVTYDDIAARITSRTCQHCHIDPLTAGGDGGAGATGGFGFAGRGLDVSSYRGLLSGSVDEHGARRSLFEKLPADVPYVGGMPRLLAHLVARKHEEAGRPIPGVIGMPLGLPAVSDEDIQLLESWIAQGRPR